VREKLTPNRLLAIVALAAAALAAALIAVSVTGGGEPSTPATVHGSSATEALLAGIPQRGNVLGDPDAPVTVVEYADFQCPYCASWAVDTFPALVSEYVRPGKVKMVFKGIAILGPDSDTALRAAVAAGQQNRLWHVSELLFHNQGEENGGWVTDDLLRSVGGAVPGLDVERMMNGRQSGPVAAEMAAAAGAAQAAGVSGTPSFEVGRSGGPMTLLRGALPAADFRRALDELLAT
jgi:protein-disulfide isomerase